MFDRFVEPADMAAVKRLSIIAGSTRIATVISLLLPSPPKAVPASSPARAIKNLPRQTCKEGRGLVFFNLTTTL